MAATTTDSANDARAMPGFRRLLAACFHKRTGRPSKSLRSEGATETDSSESTLVSLQTPQTQTQFSSLSSQYPDSTTPKNLDTTANSQTKTNTTPHFPESTRDPDSMPKARRTKKNPAKTATSSSQPYQPPASEAAGSKAKTKSFKKYFSSGGADAYGAGEGQQRKQLKDKLNQMFDELLNDEDREGVAAGESPSSLGASSTMAYIELLGANPENYGMFVVLDIVKAETMGEIARTGFVDGWAQVFDDDKIQPDLSAHKRLVQSRLRQFEVDDAYYKRLYQLAFQIGKSQKAMLMDMALVMWTVLFDPNPRRAWQSATVDWLGEWQKYLREKFWVPEPGAAADDEEAGKWTRTVSKDLWNQTLVFAQKTMQDETLGFWSEEQAWPGIIDDFVVWARDKGFVPAASKSTEQDMEIDE